MRGFETAAFGDLLNHRGRDARETIGTLIADAVAGRLPAPQGDARTFRRLTRSRARVVGARGFAALDRREVARGRAGGRTRLKFITTADLVRATRASWSLRSR